MFNWLKINYHFLLSRLSSIWFGAPSRKIYVLGVTGTKGKSTVIELINAILEKNGKRTAFTSTIKTKINKEVHLNTTGMSMPGRFYLQRFLQKAVASGCDYALIEVTSQGVVQFRDRFINFDAALITNLEPEHIEAHGSFEKYRACKLAFFHNVAMYSSKENKKFFINEASRDGEYFVREAQGKGKIIFYAKEDLESFNLDIKLLGEFNLENIAAAAAFAKSQNIDWKIIKNAIEEFDGISGRLEFIQKDPFEVVIDYAHTPDSLEKVYKVMIERRMHPNEKVICVLGAAGGGRDVWKRPIMGEIASRYCDEIILTNEDPFDDDPVEIIREIANGIDKSAVKKNYKIILDRKEAICEAIKSARPNDKVIITGKGSELYMRIARGKTIPWNEKEIVLRALGIKKSGI